MKDGEHIEIGQIVYVIKITSMLQVQSYIEHDSLIVDDDSIEGKDTSEYRVGMVVDKQFGRDQHDIESHWKYTVVVGDEKVEAYYVSSWPEDDAIEIEKLDTSRIQDILGRLD